MNWIGDFASNLSDSLFWPFVLLTAACLFIGFSSWVDRDRETYASPEYSNATWRMFTSAQGVVVMWVIWALFNAVPTPDYIVKTKRVDVVHRVNAATNFNEAFKECMGPREHNNIGDDINTATCDKIAKELVLGKQEARIVTKVQLVRASDTYAHAFKTCIDAHANAGTSSSDDAAVCEPLAKQFALGKPQVVTKEVIKQVPYAREIRYQALYNTCMGKDVQQGGWSADNSQQRNDRIKLCHQQAKEVIVG